MSFESIITYNGSRFSSGFTTCRAYLLRDIKKILKKKNFKVPEKLEIVFRGDQYVYNIKDFPGYYNFPVDVKYEITEDYRYVTVSYDPEILKYGWWICAIIFSNVRSFCKHHDITHKNDMINIKKRITFMQHLSWFHDMEFMWDGYVNNHYWSFTMFFDDYNPYERALPKNVEVAREFYKRWWMYNDLFI